MEEEWASKYSIIIVGAGIAGNALAYALAMQHPERKVLLLERSLSEPGKFRSVSHRSSSLQI
jgi:2-polyprenyl-6-methoxyphenol hydroxylase-like FAD-dependent oxidoreductase